MLKPIDDRLVIEPIKASEKTPGGIVLPDQAKERPQRAKVLAAGPGLCSPHLFRDGSFIRMPMTVKVGDTILFQKYGGSEIECDDKDLIIIRESEVLAIE